MVYLWNNHGAEMSFKDLETALMRCRFVGDSATPGVNVYAIDGIHYFTRDM